ncbi:MAG: hypothetical protein RR428_01040 [Coprobacillus sp.]
MIKSLLKLIDKKMIVLLIVALIISPTLGGKNTYTICLIYSHYLTMYLNNIYLLMIYQYTQRINTISSLIMIRISEKTFYLLTYFIFLMIGSIYTLVIYISYYFFFGAIPQDTFSLTIIFMIINFIVMGIESHIIYFQIGSKKNFVYLILPILINIVFHLTFINIF